MRASTKALRCLLVFVALGLGLALSRSALAADAAPDAQACIQASDSGQSWRDTGGYRAARDAFLQCSREGCPPIIVKACMGWLRQLDELEPTVVLGARDAQGNDLADVTVTFDGTPLASRLDGRPVVVDGGEHTLRFEHAGSVPVERRVIVRAGEKARVVTVTMASVASADAGAAGARSPAPTAPESEPVMSGRHVTAAVLFLGAAAAAGTGLYLTLRSNQDEQHATGMRAGLATDACTGVASPSCTALDDTVKSQHFDANAATALFIGGGALAVGSVVTWLVWSRPSESAPASSAWLGPVPGGAMLSFRRAMP